MRILPAILIAISCSCVSNAQQIDFAHDIVPILKTHCAKCHTGEKSEGGFSFNTERQLTESGYVIAGNPEESRLIELIQSADTDDQMPPKQFDRLTATEVSLLKKWVNVGMTWEPGFRFAASGYEPPLLPRKVTLPDATLLGSSNPIDRILAPYLADHEIAALKTVDHPTFLRRAHMDLIGLPPSPDEWNQFVLNADPNIKTRLIDELLARDHDYAEHWISFWNDLLRNDYVGTGYIDGGRKQITGWLYESLLKNKPYDQFVRELISPTDASAGFINGIKWRGTVNASQVREIQFAQNVSQVFLGINMKCASCHDSFIDRWTLDEAYGLAAIYSTRELEIHRCDKPVGRMAKAKWIFPEVGDVDPNAKQPERLKQLATVMTSPKNGRFARTIVNRIWHRMMGHGIVHPVDAMHTEPWSADLLDYLANYLVEQNYDIKTVIRLIALSNAYSSQSAPAQDSANSDEFIFQGPIARHLTAEQLMDSIWAIANSAAQKIEAPVPASTYFGDDAPSATSSGKWIWSYAAMQKSPAGEKVAFKTSIPLTAKPTQAAIAITCDNEYTLFVNGKRVGKDANWGTVEVFDLKRRLIKGNNSVFVIGRNAGQSPNPAALYAEIVLTEASGKVVRIPTNSTWQFSTKIPKPDRLDSVDWKDAVAVTPQNFLGSSIQQSLNAELSRMLNLSTRPARASLLKSNLLMRSLGRPNREQVVTVRPASLSTLQAIDLANGETLNNMLAKSASLLVNEASEQSFCRSVFLRTLCRQPSEQELELLNSILGETPTEESVQDLLWTLVMLPEFQFVQ